MPLACRYNLRDGKHAVNVTDTGMPPASAATQALQALELPPLHLMPSQELPLPPTLLMDEGMGLPNENIAAYGSPKAKGGKTSRLRSLSSDHSDHSGNLRASSKVR